MCVDRGIGLSLVGTDVIPEMEEVAHGLIRDCYKDEVWRHDPAKLFESHSFRRCPGSLLFLRISSAFLFLWSSIGDVPAVTFSLQLEA